MRSLLKSAICAVVVAFAAPAFAEDTHHPAGAAQAQPAPVQQAPDQSMRPAPTSGGMGMMGSGGMMGGDMMPMMGMMRMMHGGEHIDGRLAFIKAELEITDDQEKAWNDFATALRQAAAKVREAHSGMPAMSGAATNMTPPQLLDRHEKVLAARLEATRIVKTAFGPFYAALKDEQKQRLTQLNPMFAGIL